MPESVYAVVLCGGKQYRVRLWAALPVDGMTGVEGGTMHLEALLYAGGDDTVFESGDLGRVKVQARIVGHERGPKLRGFKLKPKRGYKPTTGHRSELTRIEVTGISVGRESASSSTQQQEEAEDGS